MRDRKKMLEALGYANRTRLRAETPANRSQAPRRAGTDTSEGLDTYPPLIQK